MATPTPTSVSQTLTSPILEGSLTAFLKNLDSLQKGAVPSTFTGIDTSTYAPKIAAESALQQQARTAAGGLGFFSRTKCISSIYVSISTRCN
jgi:hypothetical protein